MPYGELNAEVLIYSTPTGDVTIQISQIAGSYTTLTRASGTFSSLVSGVTITGTTGVFSNVQVGTGFFTGSNTTGTVLNGASGRFASGAFTYVTGTTIVSANFSGITNVNVSSGTVSSPSISFKDDSDTGFYLSDNISFSVTASGQEVAQLSTSGLDVKTENAVLFYDSGDTKFIGFKSPASRGFDSLITLPPVDGTSGQALFTNGLDSLSWRNIPSPLQSGNYQEFSGSSTWTKPSGATIVYVECVGGGGGGGGGPTSDFGNPRCGGGGGVGGIFTSRYIQASAITGNITITVGAGGSGGDGITSGVGTDGNPGAGGGASSFGAFLSTPISNFGDGGLFNKISNSPATFISFGASGNALGSGYWTAEGGTGRASGVVENVSPLVCLFSAGAGGGGGGSTKGGSIINGASGAAGFYALKASGAISNVFPSGGGGSGAIFSTPNGGSGLTYGDGGGGGTIFNTGPTAAPGATGTSGGNGGNGAIPGGGGGGGGPSSLGFLSGKGGNGARGVVRVWTW